MQAFPPAANQSAMFPAQLTNKITAASKAQFLKMDTNERIFVRKQCELRLSEHPVKLKVSSK
jgi:hypothetical protein